MAAEEDGGRWRRGRSVPVDAANQRSQQLLVSSSILAERSSAVAVDVPCVHGVELLSLLSHMLPVLPLDHLCEIALIRLLPLHVCRTRDVGIIRLAIRA